MTFTIGEDIMIAIAASAIGTLSIATLGWLFRTPMGHLFVSISKFTNRFYAWFIIFTLVITWVVLTALGRELGVGTNVFIGTLIFLMMLIALSTNREADPPE